MNEVKRQAIETMDELHQTIPYCSYCAVMDGLQEIETLRGMRNWRNSGLSLEMCR